jgi:uncharacterized DUF497 family protein
MYENIIIRPSALKHGISIADILWAFDNYSYDGLLEHGETDSEDKHLLIGIDTNANLLEIIYNFIDEEKINVFHAMKCRNSYKQFWNTGVKYD